MSRYVEPAMPENSYTCPHCQTLAQVTRQVWTSTVTGPNERMIEWCGTQCTICDGWIVWFGQERRWPLGQIGPAAHDAMPDNVKQLYLEASDVGARSPRSAAALLRLALQSLLRDLSGKRDLNDAIGELVSKGLPVMVQRAMDALRIVGNNAVHPGEIQVDDQPEVVESLFTLLNVVVESQIAQPAAIGDLYDALPQGARQAVERRDGGGSVTTP